MDKFYIISNINRDPDMNQAKRLSDYITKLGKKCDFCSVNRTNGAYEGNTIDIREIDDDTECAIVLGGDGTIIQVAGELAYRKIPVIGVNLGNLGFLAEIDKDMIYPAIDKLMKGDFYLEDRMMLEGVPYIDGVRGEKSLALNDIVLTRVGPVRVVNYDIYVNDKLLTTVSGDGVIISTPTGSTGYSMSAGGPIVEPAAMVMLVTPISDHKLNSRPIVLSPNDVVNIKIASGSWNKEKIVQASFDGGKTYTMDINDGIEIRKSDKLTRIVKISKESFLDVLSRKFSQTI